MGRRNLRIRKLWNIFMFITLFSTVIFFKLHLNVMKHHNNIHGLNYSNTIRAEMIENVTVKTETTNVFKYLPKSQVNNHSSTKINWTISEMKQEIARINSAQIIHNLNNFGLNLGNNSVVIVIQVHDRIQNLGFLFESLRNVAGIKEALIVVSHDVYSAELNSAVLGVDFCPVIQVFFPYSTQLFPATFPGTDPKDCPRNMDKAAAIRAGCNNAHHPDTYLHYRESKFTQIKHHWLWQLRHVLEEVHVMRAYRGLVLVLEDDQYVTPDVISVLRQMHDVQETQCPDCGLLLLGTFPISNDRVTYTPTALMEIRSDKRINGHGYAFTAAFWEAIKHCSVEFCHHDDYNWDSSLGHLFTEKCFRGMKTLAMKETRVYHTGMHGVHTKTSKMNDESVKVAIQKAIDRNKTKLFPNTTKITTIKPVKPNSKKSKPNGGWADLRDIKLCMNVMNSSFTMPI